ncbi:MAG: GtrA family protein [Acetobacteraceae bacterium]|nr:GtrA family protein [Acetobacteraceae bacterium]
MIALPGQLPPPLRALATGAGLQFLKFGTVGTVGFLIDTATVYALRHSTGLYAAGILAYLLAASANWALNRAWTFRGRGHAAAYRQWLRFVAVNTIGFVANRGTFVALITLVPLCATVPVLAVAAGAIAGMLLNFALSRALVFPEPTIAAS